MSKATIIRKKAMDLVRQQDWPGAIKEYRRLVEIDQSNPNVHNELADVYLKTGQKAEAYDSFVRAIEEYTRVGLYNNAVAVAKKVIRVLPARVEVFTRLGNVRMKQGLAREAESYYLTFLDKMAGGAFESAAFKKVADEIIEEMPASVPVLRRLSECLLSFNLDDEAGSVLIRLHLMLEGKSDSPELIAVRAAIDKLGIAAKLDAARGARPAGASSNGDRTVVTEDTIWTKTHSQGERIDIESTPHFAPPGQPGAAAPAQPAPAPVSEGPSARDQYLLRLARGVGGSAPKPRAAAAETPPADAAPATVASAAPAASGSAQQPAASAPDTVTATITQEAPAPEPEAPAKPVAAPAAKPAAPAAARPAAGDHTQISALIGDELSDGQGEDDYRSHYDLGMAYMEMDLLAEAIREYQAASRSPQFQVKCLEMIGLCFVRQNQPQLAIKQLSKGLALIGNESEESLGMKYNLGLAYEMIGDLTTAKTHFEDVYVVDVTFRDVAEKVHKLGEGS
ncbi:MAG TPA: tetratricopeptide repeat protein [Candidatus Krumholzibacteria bacterium]|nr:tetratricopeptide repeat protein [Candidatus Krumholzibacteria bacterium]